MKIFRNGLTTGLVIQLLTIGPVFIFIISMALQKTILDGLVGAIAITIVDYFYITLAILGIGKLIENKRAKKVFGIISSVVLIIFGIVFIKGISNGISVAADTSSTSLFSSFSSVFFLTIVNPMTIVFFTSLFTTKAIENNYTKKELPIFGFGFGLATFIFMSTSVLLFSAVKETVPTLVIQILNLIVGCLLIGYGGIRLVKVLKTGN